MKVIKEAEGEHNVKKPPSRLRINSRRADQVNQSVILDKTMPKPLYHDANELLFKSVSKA